MTVLTSNRVAFTALMLLALGAGGCGSSDTPATEDNQDPSQAGSAMRTFYCYKPSANADCRESKCAPYISSDGPVGFFSVDVGNGDPVVLRLPPSQKIPSLDLDIDHLKYPSTRTLAVRPEPGSPGSPGGDIVYLNYVNETNDEKLCTSFKVVLTNNVITIQEPYAGATVR